MRRGIVWRTLRAPAHRQGNISVTPLARAVGLRWRHGGWLWTFPVAIEVRRHDIRPWVKPKKPVRQPIVDVTRLLLILFFIVTVLALASSRRQLRRRK